jgi:NMD protein affecting ribosome stability and mRNA decay
MADFEVQTQNRNLVITKTFLWYTTCPKCAKEHGKNYVAILGKTN